MHENYEKNLILKVKLQNLEKEEGFSHHFLYIYGQTCQILVNITDHFVTLGS